MIDILIRAPIAPVGKGRPRTRVMYRQGDRVSPVPSPGAKAFAHVHTPKTTERFERDLALVAAPHRPASKLSGPTRVDVLAVQPRPKDLRRRVDPTDLMWSPRSRYDADNVRKSVLDALSDFWVDDSVVVCGDTLLAYAELGGSARTVIRIRSVETSVVAAAFELGLLAEDELFTGIDDLEELGPALERAVGGARR